MTARGPFGVQALACPAQCSLKAELRTSRPVVGMTAVMQI